MKTQKQTWIARGLIGLLLLLLVAVALPNFLPVRFVGHESLTIQLHVADRKTGRPVANAQVRLLGPGEDVASVLRPPDAVTDANGKCEFKQGFRATGTRKSGQFHISDQIRLAVEADGFKLWQSPLATMFGPTRDYYKDSRVLTHSVSLEAQPK
jgi:5-hydroxyisourate hydrolase-like protein (transthyretin family)